MPIGSRGNRFGTKTDEVSAQKEKKKGKSVVFFLWIGSFAKNSKPMPQGGR